MRRRKLERRVGEEEEKGEGRGREENASNSYSGNFFSYHVPGTFLITYLFHLHDSLIR